MFSLFRTHNDSEFDFDQDRDLVIAINEARTPAETERIARMAQQRFAARAKHHQAERHGQRAARTRRRPSHAPRFS